MGWWSDGDNDLGDDPVDRFELALGDLRRACGTTGIEPPTFQELLDALHAALALPSGAWTSSPLRFVRLDAVRSPASESLTSVGGAPPGVLLTTVLRALDGIVEAYEMAGPQRKPTLEEIVRTVAFSLRVRPERFLAGESGAHLERIVVVPEPVS